LREKSLERSRGPRGVGRHQVRLKGDENRQNNRNIPCKKVPLEWKRKNQKDLSTPHPVRKKKNPNREVAGKGVYVGKGKEVGGGGKARGPKKEKKGNRAPLKKREAQARPEEKTKKKPLAG